MNSAEEATEWYQKGKECMKVKLTEPIRLYYSRSFTMSKDILRINPLNVAHIDWTIRQMNRIFHQKHHQNVYTSVVLDSKCFAAWNDRVVGLNSSSSWAQGVPEVVAFLLFTFYIWSLLLGKYSHSKFLHWVDPHPDSEHLVIDHQRRSPHTRLVVWLTL